MGQPSAEITRADAELERAIVLHERGRCALEYGWARLTVWTTVALLALPTLWFRFGALGAAAAWAGAVLWGRSVAQVVLARRRMLALVEYFCGSEEMAAVGPLVDLLEIAPARAGERVRFKLADLLGRVSGDQFPRLSPDQRRALRAELLYRADTDLAIAILHAYETIGDQFEREVVRMLAEGILTRIRDPRVQPAAQSCLRSMDPTYRGPLQGDLLIPAFGPNISLLRPAAAGPANIQTLLRPEE